MIQTPIQFAEALLAYCYATSASVTSWGRTREHNAEVGGNTNSFHRTFMGADVVYDNPVPIAEARMLAKRFGIRVVRESDHDHLQVEVNQ